MLTILKVLETAEYNLEQGTIRATAMNQLHNVVVLLRKGYDAHADFAGVLGDHAGVEQVPEKGDGEYRKKRTPTDRRILLEALITEREGMLAENTQRVTRGESLAFVFDHFDAFADKMRALIEDTSKEKSDATRKTT